jgi:hypothetical protein
VIPFAAKAEFETGAIKPRPKVFMRTYMMER